MRRCFVCGESNERLLEWHHIYGKKYGDQGVWLCLNHHRLVTDNQNQIPTKFRKSFKQKDKDRFAFVSGNTLITVISKELVEISKRLARDEYE